MNDNSVIGTINMRSILRRSHFDNKCDFLAKMHTVAVIPLLVVVLVVGAG